MRTSFSQKNEAFRWLDKACDIKDPRLGMIRGTPRADRLKEDPRFQIVLDCVALPALPGSRD